jgi:hypothetical protein
MEEVYTGAREKGAATPSADKAARSMNFFGQKNSFHSASPICDHPVVTRELFHLPSQKMCLLK